MERLESVLVLRLSSLGDVLFALPAVQALARSGLAARVTWLVEDRAAPLLEPQRGLFDLAVFPRRRRGRWPAWVLALRRRRDDVVLDMQGSLKSRAQLAFLRAPRKIGFDGSLARDGAQAALTQAVQPPPWARHRVAQGLALVGALGLAVPRTPPRPTLPLSASEVDAARALLASAPGEGPAVLLHPGTSAFGELKRWPPERFAALGAALHGRRGARILVTGTPAEAELVRSVRAGLGTTPSLEVPSVGIGRLSALLAAVDLVVAADSLPLHLANAHGTPVLGLYGPKDPSVTGPFFDRSRVVRSGVACSPCTLRRCHDRICMDRLELAPVLAAALELLEAGPGRA